MTSLWQRNVWRINQRQPWNENNTLRISRRETKSTRPYFITRKKNLIYMKNLKGQNIEQKV